MALKSSYELSPRPNTVKFKLAREFGGRSYRKRNAHVLYIVVGASPSPVVAMMNTTSFSTGNPTISNASICITSALYPLRKLSRPISSAAYWAVLV